MILHWYQSKRRLQRQRAQMLPKDYDDPLAPARGVMFALLFTAIMGLVGYLVYLAL